MFETIKEWFNGPPPAPIAEGEAKFTSRFLASWVMENLGDTEVGDGVRLSEAFTQADIELALDDRGWLVGGKRMAGELDPLSRQVQVNRSRYYWLRDPLAKQAVRLWTDYAFGSEAVTWNCEDETVQGKLDKFMHDRRNRRITSCFGMRRLSQRLLVDGEIFFVLFADGTVRFFDCLQVTDIITDPDDEDTVLAYKRVTSGAFGASPKTLYYKPWDYNEDYKGELKDQGAGKAFTWEKDAVVYHLAFDAFEKRGSTLFGACSDWSREHRRFMTARVAITQALARFAFKSQVKGGQKVMDSIRSKMESTYAQSGLSGGTEHQPPNAPGGTWLQNEGVNLEVMPRVTGAAEAKTDADGLKLMVSAGTGIMLHYFGDPSTGNLATATAMELPMLKMFGAYQQLWKDAWRDIFSIVLEEQPDDEQAEIAINLPEILEEDLQKLGAFLAQFTAAFPEAKVPAVMRECLVAMGVENLNEVMEAIADQKEENDAKAADLLKQGVMTGKDGKPVPPTQPGKDAGVKDGGAAGTNPDNTEAELIRKLDALLEAMR